MHQVINNHHGDVHKVFLFLHVLYLLLKKIFYVITLHIVFQIAFQTAKGVTGDTVSYCHFDSHFDNSQF